MAEALTRTTFFVRLQFRPLGATTYLRHQAQDESSVLPAEAESFTPHLVRLPLRGFGRNPYLSNPAVEGVEQLDDAGGGLVVVPNWDGLRLTRAGRFNYWTPGIAGTETVAQDETLAPHLVRVPFRGLGRNPYLWHQPLDPGEAVEGLAPFVIRPTFRPYARRPELGWAAAGDVEGPAAPSLDVGSRLLVVRRWDGLRLTRAGRYAYWGQAHDDFVAPPPEEGPPPHFIVRRPLRAYGRNPYLHHRDWENGPPPPTFVAAWARNANVLLKAGLVP